MANWCYNSVQFKGAPQLLSILHAKMQQSCQIALQKNEGFYLPFLEVGDNSKALFECEFDLDGDSLLLTYQSKWGPSIEDLFLLAYGFNLTCEGSAEESGMWMYGEYRCTKESELSTDYLFEFRDLDNKEYSATKTTDSYKAYLANPEAEIKEDDEDEDEDDFRYDRLEELLSSKPWEEFEINPTLLIKKIHESVPQS
jgi:hypothetical protein